MGYNVGEGIKEFRKKRGYTQAQLAKLLGISKETLSNYETGRSTPSMTIIVKIAQIGECSTDDILKLNRFTIIFEPNVKKKEIKCYREINTYDVRPTHFDVGFYKAMQKQHNSNNSTDSTNNFFK